MITQYLWLLLFSLNSFAKGNYCPSPTEMRLDLETRLVHAQSIDENLSKFVTGSGKINLPVSALFTIDFDDATAIERRVQDLKQSLTVDPLQSNPYSDWLKCGFDETIKSEIRNLAKLDRKADEMRLNFFLQDQDKRKNLVNIQLESNKQTQALIDLNAKQMESKRVKAEAEKSQAEAEARTQEASDFRSKEVISARAIVERYRQELAEDQIKVTSDIQKRILGYSEMTTAIAKNAAAAPHGEAELFRAYQSTSRIWRQLVNQSFRILTDSEPTEIPKLPAPLSSDLNTEATHEDFQKYLNSYHQASLEYTKALRARIDLNKKEKEIVSNVLLKAGAVRAQLFQLLRKAKSTKAVELSDETIADFISEVRVVPFRLFAFFISKGAEFRRKMSSGLSGWTDIIEQGAIFLLVTSIPFVLFFLLQRLSYSIDVWRRLLITRSSLDYHYRTTIAVWLNRLNPYLPWVIMLVAAEISMNLLYWAGLSELGIFIPYLELYFYYRLVRMGLTAILSTVLISGSLEKLKTKQSEVQSSARKMSRLIFFELLILHATEDAVRRALVYSLISSFVWYFNFVFLIYELGKWREEILELADKVLPTKVRNYITKIKDRKYFTLILPFLLASAVTYLGAINLIRWLSRFDFFKQVMSDLYKKKLQDKAEGPMQDQTHRELPEEYTALFDINRPPESEYFISLSKASQREVIDVISQWMNKKSEVDALVIYGDKGIGKTSILRQAEKHFEKARVIYLDVPGKLTNAADIYTMMSQLLEVTITSGSDLLKAECLFNRTVILLDNAQNLFLAKQDGLEAYRALLDIMNLQTSNIFWCLAYNRRSWDYLKGAFGADHFYGREIEIRPWSDIEIQNLITRRHQSTGFRLTYDKVIEAVQEENPIEATSQVEAQFYRLLWGQSRGNPRAAMLLWLSALKYLGQKKILVGIPQFLRRDDLVAISDETLFVLSAIVRHENLAIEEVIEVTSIESARVKKAIKYCEDSNFIHRDSYGRLRTTPTSQYFVNNLLLGKNFLYE